jgi:nucleoid DNA-binding protein
MKKAQLAQRLAKESRITTAAAADQLDRMVSDILQRVRSGQTAALPGLGTFRPGHNPEFQFERRQRLATRGGRVSKESR